MKFFEEPIVEVMSFEAQDVVTTSNEPVETTQPAQPDLPAMIGPCG